MELFQFIELVGQAIDAVGVSVIALGALIAAGGAAARLARRLPAYRPFRQQLGSSILLGLEFLVAADIIRTVAVTPEPRAVLVLAGIVLIRTFLSYTLELEITGYWPWQSRQEKRDRAAQLAAEAHPVAQVQPAAHIQPTVAHAAAQQPAVHVATYPQQAAAQPTSHAQHAAPSQPTVNTPTTHRSRLRGPDI